MDFFMGAWRPHGRLKKSPVGARAGVGLRLQWTLGWGVRLQDQSCGIRAAHYGTGLLQPSAPEPAASRQRESFPWKKMRTQSSQKEIPELPCQESCSSRGDAHRLPSKSELSRLTAPLCKETRGGKSWCGSGWTRPSWGR